MLAPAASPARERTRSQRLRAPALTIAGLALASAALRLRDPHSAGSWGLCPSAALGVWCPGCGGLRAVNDLTRGEVGAAASSNLLFVALLPVIVFVLGRWLVDRWRGVERPEALALSRTAAGVLLASVLAFTVLRNLAIGSWLAP